MSRLWWEQDEGPLYVCHYCPDDEKIAYQASELRIVNGETCCNHCYDYADDINRPLDPEADPEEPDILPWHELPGFHPRWLIAIEFALQQLRANAILRWINRQERQELISTLEGKPHDDWKRDH